MRKFEYVHRPGGRNHQRERNKRKTTDGTEVGERVRIKGTEWRVNFENGKRYTLFLYWGEEAKIKQ